MTDYVGDAIMKEMTLRALQVATLRAALGRMNTNEAERPHLAQEGLLTARRILVDMIDEIEAAAHV